MSQFLRGSLILSALTLSIILPMTAIAQEDPYLWLEDVTGEKALTWVKEQNAVTQKRFEASSNFAPIQEKILAVLNSKERIPGVGKRGDWLYNFWNDANNPRGVWRRTTMDEYKKAEPKWELVLDIDALGKAENVNWVWKGSTCLYPKYERCLVSLSRGGADAVEIREFDTVTKSFVKDGFLLKEAKGSANFIDKDTLYVQTDFGPGSQTKSGYARIVKQWKRGTPITEAKTIFEGQESDIAVSAVVTKQKGYPDYHMLNRGVSFFNSETYLRNDKTGKFEKLDLPEGANAGMTKDWIGITLRKPWDLSAKGGKAHAAGTVLMMKLTDYLAGKRNFDVLFEPTERTALAGFTSTKNYMLINVLDNVRNRVYEFQHKDGKWVRREVALPGFGSVGVGALDDDESDEYFFTHTDFLTPSTLYLAKAGSDTREKLKSLPAFFDASPYEVVQQETASKDGTKVPYFVLKAKTTKLDGTNPTLLYGYGGFQVSQTPNYSALVGNAWLANGGIYVVANIRGGGEFGPRWHQAGLKENRQRVFDDFIAVAEDLITRKITAPKHLAISGGSNGGLLVGAVMLQRPELFRAVVCAVPLLDMKRYHKLLAGASWVAEYGNPDDAKEWDYISKYSPYQNVKKGAKYPTVLFVTSTRDDRVHPGHARKMMALMKDAGADVHYYENIEGGHAASADNKQLAYRTALQYSFLLSMLK